MVQGRNTALCIVLSIVTCGIYAIYWFICLTNDMEALTPNDDYQTSGGTAFLLTLVTCGIYGFYWAYKMGEKTDMLKGSGDSAILFIVLQVIGLGIVNYALMQNAINERVQY
jgi:hypothetical protein